MKAATKSRQLYQRALKLIPGGVNSPVRACKSVGADPLFIRKAEGAVIVDADGNRYIDYIGSWGPMILGHGHPAVVEAITPGARAGAPASARRRELEIELAELVVDAVPVDGNGAPGQLRHRGHDERHPPGPRVHRARQMVKFDGCYHGHADTLLVAAGSGVATLGVPERPGVPRHGRRHPDRCRYNDLRPASRLFAGNRRTRSPPSSSSRWPATWAGRPRPRAS